MTGSIPNDARRERALRLVRREAARIRPDVQVIDRMSIRGLARVA